MTELAHQKFHTLLQVAADQALRPEEQIMLDRHLSECVECRKYAQGLDQLQDSLRRLMQQQWNVRSTPLRVEAIKARSHRTITHNHFAAAFSKFAFIPMLALTIFMVLTIKTTNPQKSSPSVALSGTPSMALLIPKPPASITAVKLRTQTCKQVTYSAQENETLSSIAIKFSVPEESIAAYNGISGDRLNAPLTLIIPICEHTPLESTTTPTIPNTMTIPLDSPSPRG